MLVWSDRVASDTSVILVSRILGCMNIPLAEIGGTTLLFFYHKDTNVLYRCVLLSLSENGISTKGEGP